MNRGLVLLCLSLLFYSETGLSAELVERQEVSTGFGQISLTSFNKHINKWFVIKIAKGEDKKYIHIENVLADNQLKLTKAGIDITNFKLKRKMSCDLWSTGKKYKTTIAQPKVKNPYRSLCDGLLYSRFFLPSDTELSSTEKATEILRKYSSFSESLINSIKPMMVKLKSETAEIGISEIQDKNPIVDGPFAAIVKTFEGGRGVNIENSTELKLNRSGQILYGDWYPAEQHKGVYASIMTPSALDKSVLDEFRGKKITDEEKDNLVYLTAYDLSKFSTEFVVGSRYPALEKDHMIKDSGEEADAIVPVGKIPPYKLKNSVAVFIGGFKRQHGMFKYGPHRGKTYGYIQNGVELAKMSPGLATMVSYKNGDVDIIRWPKKGEMEKRLRRRVTSARQNGVFLIKDGLPGKFINSWGAGNWSGSSTGRLTTLRSAVCIQEKEDKKYLLFAAFTGATPSTVAKVMSSYSCSTAMHLDMNAYMYVHNALFTYYGPKKAPRVEYLHEEMRYPKRVRKHRYILDNNNRDFFYVYKK